MSVPDESLGDQNARANRAHCHKCSLEFLDERLREQVQSALGCAIDRLTFPETSVAATAKHIDDPTTLGLLQHSIGSHLCTEHGSDDIGGHHGLDL